MDNVGWSHKFSHLIENCTNYRPELIGMGVVYQQYTEDKTDAGLLGTLTITSGSDATIYTSDLGGPVTIDIPDGTYNPLDIANALSTGLNNSAVLTGTGTIYFNVYIDNEHLVVDAGTGHTIAYTHSGSDGGTMLGFNGNITASQTITAQNPITENTA